MSIQTVGWVLSQPGEDLPIIPRMILVAIANHADHKSGHCWPSIATIASEAGCSTRTVNRYLPLLASNGFLGMRQRRAKDGRRTSSDYFITFDRQPGTKWVENPGKHPSDTESFGPVQATLESSGPSDSGVAYSEPSLSEPSEDPPLPPKVGGCGGFKQDGEDKQDTPADPPSPAEPVTAFAELVAVWPRENLGTGDRAEKRFRRLAAEERRAAIDGARSYIAGQRTKGRTKICDLAGYIAAKHWKPVAGAAQASGAGWESTPPLDLITVEPGSTLAQQLRRRWEISGAPSAFLLAQLRAGKPITVTREQMEAPAPRQNTADHLRQMTVERGCTPAEAEAARVKLQQIEGRAA